MIWIGYVALGLLAGVLGGALGVGGGAIMVPIMVMAFGLSQHQAQGTALAVMMLPVFVLSVWQYHQAGNVHVQMALFIALGFVVGAFTGANIAQHVSATTLKRCFGVLLLLMSIKYLFSK